MAGSRKKKSWGFPRWGEYGQDRDTINVKMCDYHSCGDKADFPAPKSPTSEEKWMFCQKHAAEYNKNWDFFEGMSVEEAGTYAKNDRASQGRAYANAGTYEWAGVEGSDGLTVVEREAMEFFELKLDASPNDIKVRYRNLAKQYHPDHNQGDNNAAQMFQKVRAAHDVLKRKIAVQEAFVGFNDDEDE
jgi:DnaJ-domain-containing protein 1